MKNYKIIDVEATTFQQGHPHSQRNRLCLYGIGSNGDYRSYPIEYSLSYPYGAVLLDIREQLLKSRLLVGINIKYDLEWGYYYGLEIPVDVLIWDCSIAHYIFTGQRHPYPSMNDLCEYFGIPKKEDKIAEYWANGIDTPDINFNELVEYNINDLKRTESIFLKQLEEIPKDLWKLILNSSKDSHVTSEIEFAGIKFDKEKSIDKGNKITSKISEIDRNLSELVCNFSINWNSGDHISAILYGGIVKSVEKEIYEFVYKDLRKGSKLKERKVIKEYSFPRLVEPLPRSELLKEGFFSTDIKTLELLQRQKLSPKAKEIINLLLERTRLETEVSKYYFGIPKLMENMDWPDGYIHPQFNHVRTLTGRLSGTKPNPQNIPEEVRECLVSRY